MVRRDVAARYRGSVLGVFWSLFTPLLMLGVYTFVFGTVFRARGWAAEGEHLGTAAFALILFSGLIPFTLFSEVVGKAPRLIVSNRNYVKKVVFPIEILPVVGMGAALVQMAVSFGVLIVFLLVSNGGLPWTALFLPVVLAPFAILTLGFCWVLASLGVYLRDLSQILPPILSGTMFLSAIFYPLSSLPDKAQLVLLFGNPLVFPIEQVREVLIYGLMPNWAGLLLYSVVAVLLAWAGYAFFQKTRKGFADVL
jgi:lipopolysaccharide transport system permease protein